MRAAGAIRRLLPGDATRLVALRREALETDPFAFAASPEDDRGLSIDLVSASLADTAGQAVFGYVDGDRLAGMVGIVRGSKVKQRHTATIWGMYVSPRARSTGAGRALLDAAVQCGRGWGLAHVQLSVTEAAPVARRMYESAGFRVWGREPRALRWDGRFVDDYHLQLALDD